MWQVCIPPVFGNLVYELKKIKFSAGGGLGDPPPPPSSPTVYKNYRESDGNLWQLE